MSTTCNDFLQGRINYTPTMMLGFKLWSSSPDAHAHTYSKSSRHSAVLIRTCVNPLEQH